VEEKARGFYPLCQLASAFTHVRKYGKDWCVEKIIVVCRFSAAKVPFES